MIGTELIARLLQLDGTALRNEAPQLSPALGDLARAVENFPPWHHRQSVLDHTAAALDWHLTAIDAASPCQLDQLREPVGSRSRLEALRLAVVLHDIAKPLTLTVDAAGLTSCHGHEALGADMVRELIGGSGDSQFTDHVAELVRRHGELHSLLTHSSGSTDQLNGTFAEWRAANDAWAPELLRLTEADLLGSHMALLDPFDFSYRMCFCQLTLEALVPG